MPDKTAVQRARRDARARKAPSVQAGEFVREGIHHIREGKHGARSAKQVIAIGLSKARRAGIALPPKPGAEPKAPAVGHRGRTFRTEGGAEGVGFARRVIAAGPPERCQAKSRQSACRCCEGRGYQGSEGHAQIGAKGRCNASPHALKPA